MSKRSKGKPMSDDAEGPEPSLDRPDPETTSASGGTSDDRPSLAKAPSSEPAESTAVQESDAAARDESAEPVAETDAAETDAPPEHETRSQRRKREKAKKPRRKAPWWELPALVALAIGIAILVKTFVVQPFYIPSDSMEQTLHGCDNCHGDRILVNKPIYDFRDPHPGDIVVFNDPKLWKSKDPISRPPSNPFVRTIRGFGQLVGFVPPDGQVLVKRVIATGGQTVKGDSQGHVMISSHGADGPFRTLKEPYVYTPKSDATTQSAFGPVTIPKGRLWVMGDHRTDSADSRYHCTPDSEQLSNETNCDPVSSTVPIDDVIGKAFVIAWPPSRWRTLGTPSTFEDAAMSAAPVAPSLVGTATVVPIFLVRRRRRRGADSR